MRCLEEPKKYELREMRADGEGGNRVRPREESEAVRPAVADGVHGVREELEDPVKGELLLHREEEIPPEPRVLPDDVVGPELAQQRREHEHEPERGRRGTWVVLFVRAVLPPPPLLAQEFSSARPLVSETLVP